jgi:diguanylate cyclase (GGDEF)-like protein
MKGEIKRGLETSQPLSAALLHKRGGITALLIFITASDGLPQEMCYSYGSMLEKSNILIIDDSEALRKNVREALQRARLTEYCFEAKSGLEGIKVLMEKRVDLIICDIIMPEFDGFKFLISKGSRPEFDSIPVILLTSQDGVAQKIKGLEQGASDYIVKPFDEGELIARVKVHLKVKLLQDELLRMNRELQELIGLDPLTRMNTRSRFLETSRRELSRARRYRHPIAFVMMNIDLFESVNDRYGQDAGDAILARVADVIRQNIRLSDLVGRLGGGRMILLLPQTRASAARAFAERIRAQVEGTAFSAADRRLPVTISAGVASYPDIPAESIEELLRISESAIDRAKKAGGNRVEIAVSG